MANQPDTLLVEERLQATPPTVHVWHRVPVELISAYVMGLALFNCTVFADIARTPGTFLLPWALAIALALLVAGIAARTLLLAVRGLFASSGLNKLQQTHFDGLLVVQEALLVAFNARVWYHANYCNYPTLLHAHQESQPCLKCVYFWIAALVIQSGRVPPKDYSRSAKHVLRIAGYAMAFGTLLFFTCWSTREKLPQERKFLGFLVNNGVAFLPKQAMILQETIHFVETGEGGVVGVLCFIQAVDFLVGFYLWSEFGFLGFWAGLLESSHDGSPLLLLLILLQLLILGFATRDNGTAAVRLPDGSTCRNQNLPDAAIVSRPRWWWAFFTGTFCGQCLMEFVSWLITLVIYAANWENLNASLRDSVSQGPAVTFGNYFRIQKLVTATIAVSVIGALLSLYNLASDIEMFPRLAQKLLWLCPNDGHFSIVTLLRTYILWLKIVMLAFTSYTAEKLSWSVIFQVCAVLLSICVTLIITVFTKGRNLLSGQEELRGHYSRAKLLAWSVWVIVVVVQSVIAFTMIVKVAGAIQGDKSPFVMTIQSVEPATLMCLPPIFLGASYQLANETLNFIHGARARAAIGNTSNLARIRSVLSRRPLRAMAALCAAIPGSLLANLYHFTDGQFVWTMLTGNGSWYPPFVALCTTILAAASFTANFAGMPGS